MDGCGGAAHPFGVRNRRDNTSPLVVLSSFQSNEAAMAVLRALHVRFLFHLRTESEAVSGRPLAPPNGLRVKFTPCGYDDTHHTDGPKIPSRLSSLPFHCRRQRLANGKITTQHDVASLFPPRRPNYAATIVTVFRLRMVNAMTTPVTSQWGATRGGHGRRVRDGVSREHLDNI